MKPHSHGQIPWPQYPSHGHNIPYIAFVHQGSVQPHRMAPVANLTPPSCCRFAEPESNHMREQKWKSVFQGKQKLEQQGSTSHLIIYHLIHTRSKLSNFTPNWESHGPQQIQQRTCCKSTRPLTPNTSNINDQMCHNPENSKLIRIESDSLGAFNPVEYRMRCIPQSEGMDSWRGTWMLNPCTSVAFFVQSLLS